MGHKTVEMGGTQFLGLRRHRQGKKKSCYRFDNIGAMFRMTLLTGERLRVNRSHLDANHVSLSLFVLDELSCMYPPFSPLGQKLSDRSRF